jgi:glycolate oxidase
MRGVKYGATGDYVLGMEVVLASGEAITTGSVGSRSLHSASGFDLTHLFVGAEGMLGIITLLRLRLLPISEARGMVLAAFDDLEKAGQATIAVFRARLLPSAVEILDRMAIRGVNLYRPELELPEVEALLFFEVDGNSASVSHQAEKVAEVVGQYAARVDWADDATRVRELWAGRAVAGVASGLVRPDGTRIYAGEDICVPLTKVAPALRGIQEIGARHETIIVTYGHIGDGNLHSAPIIKTDDADEVRRAKLVEEEIHQLALKLGGTVTGEHGVGITRKPYMRAEHGPALDVMWRIKQVLDPQNIMNPGKMFPDEMVAGLG